MGAGFSKPKKIKGNYTGRGASNQNPSMEKVWILTGTNIYNIQFKGKGENGILSHSQVAAWVSSSLKLAITKKIW